MGRGLRSDEAMKVMGLVSLQEGRGDFPGGSVVKNPPAKAGDMGIIPGHIPHTMEQLSPCAATTEAHAS